MKRIFMVSSQLMFSRGIENLLSRQSGLEVIGREANAANAIRQIRRLRPDVVILDSKDVASIPAGIVARLLQAVPDVTVISLNLENEQMWVHHGEQRSAQCIDDLREVIDEVAATPGVSRSPSWLSLAAEQARAQAGLYGFLAALLNQAPDVDFVRRLRAVGVESLLGRSPGHTSDAGVPQALQEIAEFVEATRDQPEAELKQTLAVDWTRLFRGVTPTYGPTPPYEGLFTPGGDGLSILQTINQAYLECGAAVMAETPNRPDYLGLELGFLSFLAEQEAGAWEKGDEEQALDFASKAQRFLHAHPGRWAGLYLAAAFDKAKTGFYRGLLCLSRAMLAEAMTQAAV